MAIIIDYIPNLDKPETTKIKSQKINEPLPSGNA